MKWFEGDISEAISLSKQRNAVFVVFVFGNDEASNATLTAIESPRVSDKLSSNDFVAVKLESGSQSYHQFVQIFQLVPVPSLFFIGQSGVPLDVVPGEATSEVLLEHIHNLTGGSSSQGGDVLVKESSPAPPSAQPEAQEAPPTPPAAAAREETPPTPQPQGETEEQRAERVEQAEQTKAAAEAKLREQEKEREQARLRELEALQAKRRQEALEEQQDQQRRRERVLQQIAQDKLERASRLAAEQGTAPPTPTPSPSTSAPVVAAPITAARLQFRLPNGSTHTHVFEPQASLGEVRQYVRSTLHPARFSLSMAFPRAELAAEDDPRSLQDIGLVPSAAILVLPASSSTSGVPAAAGTGLMAMLWMLLTPFTVLWSMVSARIWGDTGTPPPPTPAGPGPAGAAAQARASQANQGEVRHRVRREGNIHRLTGSQDSDDENNTYNGNSTQQM